MKILLTGGLGYIGSHIAHLLKKNAIIIDSCVNSSLNYRKFLPHASVYINKIDKIPLEKIFKRHDIKGVIHLAGLKAVNESILKPLDYFNSNIVTSIKLLEAMDKFRINKMIFSSSATVYGNNHVSPLKEDMKLESINPYGSTKIIIEQLIKDYSKSNIKFKAISLRYFNPLGADLKAGLAEKPLGEPLNLMPALIQSIKNQRTFNIYGKNYDTSDGTCIRDYIHVKDIAKAHLLAFNKLKSLKGHNAINIGLGKGASVLEIINLFQKINKIKIDYKFTSRRGGDSAVSYASINKAKKILQWEPKFNYSDMVKDAWASQLRK